MTLKRVDPIRWWIFSNGRAIYTARNVAERDKLAEEWRAWFRNHEMKAPVIEFRRGRSAEEAR